MGGVICFRCGGEDTSVLVSLVDERRSDSEGWTICARCGEVLRAWLEGLGEEGGGRTPGPVKDQRGMFEDHAPRSEIDMDELMGDGRVIGLLLKHPDVTESRQDADRTPKDGSSSPPVASTLPEEYRWSGLE